MLTAIHPKLPMRNPEKTRDFYRNHLLFQEIAAGEFPHYAMFYRDAVEIHFFHHPDLVPAENDGQVYIRVKGIEALYHDFLSRGVEIHPNGPLEAKPWGQWEFALLDPDFNLLIFGEGIETAR